MQAHNCRAVARLADAFPPAPCRKTLSVRRVPVWLFKPLERATLTLTHTARRLQSGSLNLYLGVIGVILVLILATILF